MRPANDFVVSTSAAPGCRPLARCDVECLQRAGRARSPALEFDSQGAGDLSDR